MRTSSRRSLHRAAAAVAAACALTLAAVGPAQAAPPWLAPTDLAAPQGVGVGVPQVGVAGDGSAVVVFTQRAGAVNRIYAAARQAGGTFGPAQPISGGAQSAYEPRLGVDPQGNATAVWQLGSAVQTAFRPTGGAWGPPQALPGSDGAAPELSVGPNGGAVVTWYSDAPATDQRAVVAVRPPGSQGFGAPQFASSLTDQGPTGVYTPRAAIDAAGNVTAIWVRNVEVGGTDRNVVESAYKPAGGAFSGTAETRSGTAGNASPDVAIAMAPGGRTVAAWAYEDGSTSRIEFAERAPGRAFPAAPTPLSPGGDASAPQVVVNDDGTVAVIWATDDTVTSTVRGPGGGFSPPKGLSGPGAQAYASAVDLAPSGEAVVAWSTSQAGGHAEYAARRRPGADAFGEVTEIARGQATAPVTTLGVPTIALDDEGNGFAAWQKQSGASPILSTPQVTAYDVVAPALTTVAVPGTATTGTSLSFSAAASDRLGPVGLAWDFGDGGTASGGSVGHTYGAAGTFAVKVVATDAAGNRAEATRLIQVTDPVAGPAPAPGPATTPVPAATDGDRDGVLPPVDCDDRDAGIRPGAPEQPGNAVDENCDGRAEALPAVRTIATLRADRLRNGRTKVRSLRVTGLAKGDVVAIRCSSRQLGCRKAATRTRTVRKGTSVSFDRELKGMTLAPTAKLVVTVSRAGAASRVTTFTAVRAKAPTRRTRCQDPGVKTMRTCS